MENNIFKAIEDVNSIKNTLQDSKIHYQGIYLLCFILGIYHIMLFFLSYISFILPLSSVYSILYPLLTISMFIIFLFILSKEQKWTNKYYLSLLNTWAIIAVAIPIMTTLIEYIDFFFFKNNLILLPYNYMADIKNFADILLFSIFLIVCSYILEKKFLKLLSISNLFIYLLLTTCFNNITIPLFPNGVLLSITSIYNLFAIYIGYILLGIFIKKREKV